MQVPKITHLQFAILGILQDGPRSGKTLRDHLAAVGVRKTGPGFYQMMSRIEDIGLVDGRYVAVDLDGRAFREREYRVTSSGKAAWRRCAAFYREVSRRTEEGWATQ